MLEENSLYYNFLDVLRLHHCRMQVLLDSIGIYPGQPPFLFLLGKQEGLSQKELAKILQITPATLAVTVKRMEKAGLVTRKQDEKDQRVFRVYLTEEGKEKVQKAKEIMGNVEEDCFGKLSEEEKEQLSTLLTKVAINLKQINETEHRRPSCSR